MDELKINELVRESQSKLEKALNMKITDIRARQDVSYKQIMKEIDQHTTSTFNELYLELERWCKSFIYRRTNANRDDVWNDFAVKKLPGVIIGYNFEHKPERPFVAYLSRALTRFIYNYDLDDPVIEIPLIGISIPDPHPEPGKRIEQKELLDIFIPKLDSFRSNDDKKLVYHCKKLLREVCNCDDYMLLKNLRGQTLQMVAGLIENEYSTALRTKTRYMETITRKIYENGRADVIFLEEIEGIDYIDSTEGKQRLREWVSSIDKSFKKHKEEIINSINN